MNTGQIKRFLLRALWRMDGIPLPQTTFIESARQAFPDALESDVTTALREIETAGYAAGNRDDFDKVVTWTLTQKGEHKAKQLG